MTTPPDVASCDLCAAEPARASLMNLDDYSVVRMGTGCMPAFLGGLAITMGWQPETQPGAVVVDGQAADVAGEQPDAPHVTLIGCPTCETVYQVGQQSDKCPHVWLGQPADVSRETSAPRGGPQRRGGNGRFTRIGPAAAGPAEPAGPA